MNALRYENQLRSAVAEMGTRGRASADFEPAFELPEPTPELAEYFAAANLRFAELGTAGRTRLTLLDLMGNPATRTVKTLASLVIVARAVRHIRTTGERVLILTPSSANKATALRDAVLRARAHGLVRHDELRIVTVVPDVARPKLWSSALDDDPTSPMCVLDPANPEHVKTVAVEAMTGCAEDLYAHWGIRLWHTLDLANYQCADTVRAFAEHAELPAAPGTTRVHAHAVSSAFGLLGHHYGTTLLPPSEPPRYLLVQHLATPDMVCGLYGIEPPEYRFDPVSGLFHQDSEPHYPAVTYDPAEKLESTFYTRKPVTSPAMNELIRTYGGGGVVVSLRECLDRYGQIATLLANAGVDLPADPRSLREWSLVLAMTGVLNAIDRGLLDADEVVVHGSGSYSAADYTPIPERSLRRVGDAADLRREIFTAAGAGLPSIRVA
ncbi:hypothetical protein SAMN05421810_102563 [Amycolatopsis arida]|uniref:Uncharacterized protein n=1 Tax=Amycolatopsis arida TaxID=587909 RepID=A0A1I5QA24_9PSEU|nr:DUF6002 family protein [Amycolatopsis arida]TDX98767.1 hypothetical protein CLV69_101564 [Amycolatopsis arida]SFP43105.1 hypothetical protein SAMN05421810_102563 [Amycolatopsis arida]